MVTETFELYVKHTSNCQGVPLTTFKRLSPEYEADEVKVRFELEDEEHVWHKVVGWTDLFGGRADAIRICWVENSDQVGVLVYGGNSGIRVLSSKFRMTLGVDEHLPRGYGQPWIWLDGETAAQDLPKDVLKVIGEQPNG